MLYSKKGIRLPPTDRIGTPVAGVGQSYFNMKKKINQVTSLQLLPNHHTTLLHLELLSSHTIISRHSASSLSSYF